MNSKIKEIVYSQTEQSGLQMDSIFIEVTQIITKLIKHKIAAVN